MSPVTFFKCQMADRSKFSYWKMVKSIETSLIYSSFHTDPALTHSMYNVHIHVLCCYCALGVAHVLNLFVHTVDRLSNNQMCIYPRMLLFADFKLIFSNITINFSGQWCFVVQTKKGVKIVKF